MTPAKISPTCIVLLALTTGLSFFAPAQTPPAAAQTTPAASQTQTATQTPSPTPALNGIAHIAIRVQDIAASVAFYHKLGFEQAFAMTGKDGSISQAFLKLNDRQFIELYPVSAQGPPQNAKPGFLHLCFEGADLNAVHDYYVAEGLTPLPVRKAGAGNMLFTMKGPQQFSDPQNIEYTQYMPESLHSKDFGQHLGPDRVAGRMTVVALAMQDPAAARAFYIAKLGFLPAPGNPQRLNLPGTSGQQVEIVPIDPLGARSSILLETSSLDKAEAQLTRQKVAFQRARSELTGTGADGKTIASGTSKEMISVTDPDGNILRIESQP